MCSPAPKSGANCLIINNGRFQVNFTKRQRVVAYLMKSLALPGVPIAALHFNNAQPSTNPPASLQHPFTNPAAQSVPAASVPAASVPAAENHFGSEYAAARAGLRRPRRRDVERRKKKF